MRKGKVRPPEDLNIGAQAEAERYFAARGSRTTPARAKALLARLGTAGELRDDDRLDASDEVV